MRGGRPRSYRGAGDVHVEDLGREIVAVGLGDARVVQETSSLPNLDLTWSTAARTDDASVMSIWTTSMFVVGVTVAAALQLLDPPVRRSRPIESREG